LVNADGDQAHQLFLESRSRRHGMNKIIAIVIVAIATLGVIVAGRPAPAAAEAARPQTTSVKINVSETTDPSLCPWLETAPVPSSCVSLHVLGKGYEPDTPLSFVIVAMFINGAGEIGPYSDSRWDYVYSANKAGVVTFVLTNYFLCYRDGDSGPDSDLFDFSVVLGGVVSNMVDSLCT
jgi:hypothetical protein